MPAQPERITYFGETDLRGRKTRFGIKAKDRNKHMYVIGKSGMGKSTLLENMAIQDLRNDEGLAFFDPHGAAAEKLLDYIPERRVQDVVYFAPYDMEYPVGFNIMEDVGYDKRHLVVAGLMSAFKKIWVDAWSSRMEYILENTLLALLEYPESTMLDVNRMYTDKEFRKAVVGNVSDPIVKAFWEEEYAKYTDRYTQEATPAIQNKVGQFTANPLIRNIIGQPQSAFDIRWLMDNKKIFIADLSKGRIGEKNAQLLGSMLVTKFYLAALSRADAKSTDLEDYPDFYFYVDEFQSFANESFADILSEARKYKLDLILAHQYVEQMPEEVRAAVFGNVGTMVTFRIGAYDADVLEKEFAPQFSAEDLVNLGFAQIYLKLMIDGVSSQPFSATTIPPLEQTESSHRPAVVAHSRRMYARPRPEIEQIVSRRNNPYEKDPRVEETEQTQGKAGAEGQQQKNGGGKGGGKNDGKQKSGGEREAPPPAEDDFVSLADLAKQAQAQREAPAVGEEVPTSEQAGESAQQTSQQGTDQTSDRRQQPQSAEDQSDSAPQHRAPRSQQSDARQGQNTARERDGKPGKHNGQNRDTRHQAPDKRGKQKGGQHGKANRDTRREQRGAEQATTDTADQSRESDNRASLRAALAGLTRDPQKAQRNETPADSQTRSASHAERHSRAQSQAQQTQHRRDDRAQHKEKKRHEEQDSTDSDQRGQRTESGRSGEVPEEVLRRVLTVDGEEGQHRGRSQEGGS